MVGRSGGKNTQVFPKPRPTHPPMDQPDPGPPIARTALHEEVIHRLRDMIVEMKLRPGERIQEMEIARQLGVSRTPIREALKVLTAEGLVELLPLRGAIVKAFSAKDARDMLEVIALLEEYAGLQAVQASEPRVQAILGLHAQMSELYKRRERAAYFKLNQQIHQALIALSDNETLQLTHATLSKRMRGLRYRGNSQAEHWDAAMAEHEHMMQALAKRDGPALSRIMGQHIRNTWPRIEAQLS